MKTITLLSVFLFCFCCHTTAQTPLPPVYEIKADTTVFELPDVYWQMLVDTNGKWTIAHITSPPVVNKFHKNNTTETGFGYSNLKHYWQRLRLKNSTGKDLTLIFGNRVARVDRFDMYVFRNSGSTDHLVSGAFVPYKDRDAYKGRMAVPVQLATGEEIVVYKKLYIDKVDSSPELKFGLGFYDNFIQQAYVNEPWYVGDVRNWFIAGLLIFGFFINVFFFWIVREKVYLYMSLLLLFEGLWYLTLNDTITFRNNPTLRDYFQEFVTHVGFFFCVSQFVRHFLKTYKYYPRWDKVLIILITLMAVTALGDDFLVRNHAPFSWRGIPDFIEHTSFAALMFALFFSFIFFKKERDALTNLAVIAALPAFFLWSFGYYAREIFGFLDERYGTNDPRFMLWYYDNENIIEMFCVAWFAILFTWILLQRYALLRKQYTQQALEREKERSELMEQQKILLEKEVEERTAELKHSLEELKTTQKQLIHSEKMASLGELTAGIAHEIQNPLNFVNNFSEVSVELADDLEKEVKDGNQQESIAIAESIKENLQKVVHHGKRADAIVKGMLHHSRSSTGKKEPTDINALADEYLRLSYHGLRAKDKSFNATTHTEFDESLEKVSVIPQDIGRVLLNLYTNAFYSVSEKKNAPQPPEGGVRYEPTVWVSTKAISPLQGGLRGVEISVRDNGLGIPKKVLEKIYQPFFTTKPAGEGTGLGLSMSYDIIKAHNGEMKVETKEGEFAEFTIEIPFTNNMP